MQSTVVFVAVLLVAFTAVVTASPFPSSAHVRRPSGIRIAQEMAATAAGSGYGPEKAAQHAGYIKLNNTRDANIFYWMFESRQAPKTDPIVMWFTGGPGCSSELALFYENGPYKINDDLSLNINNQSWNSFANLIFVDQPVGTGYSYTDDPFDYVTNEKKMAEDMWNFLQQFLAQYPQYQGLPFYLMGESYAGHYVPAFGARIVQGNSDGNHLYHDAADRAISGVHIPFEGMAIGNGWVDPVIQYGQYAPFAYANKLISEASYAKLNQTYESCQKKIAAAKKIPLEWPFAYSTCMSIVSDILAEAGNINVYDIRKNCTYPPLCYNFSNLSKFLAQDAVKTALGVGNRKWSDCSTIVHTLLLGDWVDNYEVDVPKVLAAGTRVVVYSGADDFICNWMGGRQWVSEMQWPGQQAYNAQAPQPWMVNGVEAGTAQAAQNLTFVKVLNAGHMVPMDQPVNALDLVSRLVNNTPFGQ